MIFVGELRKSGRFCSASLHPVQGYGQGKTPDAACADLAAGIVELAEFNGFGKNFTVSVTHDDAHTVYVTSSDPNRLLALLLLDQRVNRGLSLADVAEKTGAKSRNGYAQYEQCRREPSISQLTKLLEVVAPDLQLAIIPRNAQVIAPEQEVDEHVEMLLEEIVARRKTRKRDSKPMRMKRATKRPAAKKTATKRVARRPTSAR